MNELNPTFPQIPETADRAKPPKEVEVKYTIDPNLIPPEVEWDKELRLTQAYLEKTDDSETRIRSTTEGDTTTYELTHKSAPTDDGLVRTEETIPITASEFKELLQQLIGNVIEKTRRTLQTPDGLTIEYDEYHGALKGLHAAEVEFDSEEAARKFTPPSWFGEDVTSNKAYKNANLALKGLPTTE